MSTLKTNNIEHLDASTPSIQTTIGGGTILAGVSTVSDTLVVGGTDSTAKLNVFGGDIQIGTGLTFKSSSSTGNINLQGGYTYPGGWIKLSGGSSDDNIVFGTSSNNATKEERLRINSNGDLGINTIGGNYTVQMHEPSAGSFTLQMTTGAIGSANTSGARITASSSRKLFIENQENEDTLFYNNGGEKLVIKAGGNVNITNGDLVVANGHGIDFSATSDGSGTSTSELLDDYEEGTWTPVPSAIGGGGTWVATEVYAAGYTKVGNVVTVNMFFSQIYYTGTPLSYLEISGLPFTKKSNSFAQGPCVVTNVSFGADSYVVVEPTNTTSATNKCYFKVVTNNSGGSDLQANLFSNTAASLRFTMTYLT